MLFIIALVVLTANSAHGLQLCETGTCQTDAEFLKILGSGGTYGYTSGVNGTWTWSDSSAGSVTASGESGCFISSSSPSGSNNGYCWCRVTSINGQNCVGPWVYENGGSGPTACVSPCAHSCGACARNGVWNACSRTQLFAFP